MFEILLFDIDDTLLDFHKAEFNAFQQVCKQYNIQWTEEFYNTYKEINLSCWKQLEKGMLKRSEVYTKRFEDLFSIYKYKIDTEKFNKDYFSNLRLHHPLMPNALEVLQQLQHKRLYVVTNSDKYVQQPRYTNSGLSKYFIEAFISEDTGYEKPSLQYFEYVADRIIDFDKEKTLIIGDSLSSDIKGGNNFGIRTCWYNPKGKPLVDGYQVDYEIHDLLDLLPIVNQ